MDYRGPNEAYFESGF